MAGNLCDKCKIPDNSHCIWKASPVTIESCDRSSIKKMEKETAKMDSDVGEVEQPQC